MNNLFGIPLLFIITLAINCNTEANEKIDFSGYWFDCEPYQGQTVCSGYTLRQQGTKVCGAESSFATSKQFESYLRGEVKDNLLEIETSCRTDSPSACPTFTTSKHASLLLCDQKLYVTEIKICKQVMKSKTLKPLKKTSAEKYEALFGKPDFTICAKAKFLSGLSVLQPHPESFIAR